MRVMSAVAILAVLIGLWVARLIYLQIYQHSLYVTLSNKNQLNIIPIEPMRGLIYDRKGILLANNVPIHTLDIVREYAGDLEKTFKNLSEIISITPEETDQFLKSARQSLRFEPVTLKYQLSEVEMADFYANQYRFPGVVVNTHFVRYYPNSESTVHAVGYMGRIDQNDLKNVDAGNYSASDHIGKAGIEKYYEEALHGKIGHQQIEVDVRGRVMRVLKNTPPTSGETLYLSIDSQLQKVAQEAFGEEQGALVAIDPKTGQILAFVSQPGYDSNPFVQGMNYKAYQALNESEQKPLYNRALKGLYSPGSTIKPFAGLMALDLGLIHEGDAIHDPGIFRIAGTVFHDHVKNGHGMVNMAKAIMVSCDIYFYQLALKLGISRLGDAFKIFGMGAPSGIDLFGEASGLVPDPEWQKKRRKRNWSAGDTVNSGIGQGAVLATPLQMANAAAMMANRGERYRPTLVAKRKLPTGEVVPSQPVLEKKWALKNEHHWDVIINAMKDVAHSPSGTALRYFGAQVPYQVAGKTGTTEVHRPKIYNEIKDQFRPKKYRNHKWFIAFAPADQPKIALAVVVEHNSTAVHIARTVLDYYLLGKLPKPPEPEESKIVSKPNKPMAEH